jgi:GH25 family lysozyme M1 (1,4-beta-N-acetylmuramidase)
MATVKLIVVDLSHYDTVTDLNAAKGAGLAGIIYKATQGSGYQDPTYASRRSEAAAAGLLWGAYHFGDNSSVQTQVSNFLAAAQPDANTLVALDYEPNGDATMSLDQASQFLTLVGQQIGRQPVLYSGSLIKQTLTQPNTFFGSHRLWLAQYASQPVLPSSWQSYWLWQYSDGSAGPQPQSVPGIPGNSAGQIDCNTFDGTPDELAAQWAG